MRIGIIRQHIQKHPLLLEQKELLLSIPGIAEITAAKLLAEIPNLKNYKTARQAAAYAGLTTQQRVSGTSVQGKSCLSKKGNSRVGKALYMPAVVAQRHNPIIQQFRDRLRQKGGSNAL
ncbi:transposase [Myxosarcina sp. GI1(2024)]